MTMFFIFLFLEGGHLDFKGIYENWVEYIINWLPYVAALEKKE